jgi:sugar-specific transcriptional regulator TrmB
MENTVKALLDLGLTDKEAKVYLASLELGPATAQQLAAKAAVVRPTAYVAIGGLVKRGLVSQVTRGKKQYFQSEKPGRLAQLLESEKRQILEREQTLKHLLPMLQSLVASAVDRPEAKYYEGTEGLEALHRVFVESRSKNLDLVVARRDANDAGALTSWALAGDLKMRLIRARQGGRGSAIVAKGITTRELVRKDLGFDGEIAIFGDHVALVSRQDKPYGVLIHGADFAGLARLMFDGFWASLE